MPAFALTIVAMLRSLLACAATGLLLGAAAAASAQPAGPAARAKPRSAAYPATINVAGDIIVKQRRTSSGPCSSDGAGGSYESTLNVDSGVRFGTGTPRKTVVTFRSGRTGGSIMTRKRAVVHTTDVLQFADRRCPNEQEDEPPMTAPRCASKLTGRLQVDIINFPLADPIHRTGRGVKPQVGLSITRYGGGRQGVECLFQERQAPLAFLGGSGTWNATVGAWISPIFQVPIGARTRNFLRLPAGKRLTRTVSFEKDCSRGYSPRLVISARVAADVNTRSCTARGRFVFTLKRLRRR